MRHIKLYNIIFPIWIMLFFPPVILLTLAGNFILDSVIVVACYFLFNPHDELNWLAFYKKSILKVWVFGLMVDIIGAVILILCIGLQDLIGLSNEVIQGISYDPFSSLLAIILIIASMLISAFFIILFNYNYTFHNLIKDELTRWKVVAFIALITLPWTFLLPTKWFF